MKLIIAGGRTYSLTERDIAHLDAVDRVGEVVSWCPLGVGRAGEARADGKGIPVRRILPEWSRYGRCAGVVRNREMVA